MMVEIFHLELDPGSIVVVGPNGKLIISNRDSGGRSIQFTAKNCDFIGPVEMSDAHRAIVDERWAARTETGVFQTAQVAPVDMPASLAEKFMVKASEVPPVKVPKYLHECREEEDQKPPRMTLWQHLKQWWRDLD